MEDKKVLFIQSFSENIYDLNALTMPNHVRYFNRHGYSFLFKNEKYDAGVFSFKSVKKYLEDYDVVVTLGCDCVITDPDVSITDFSSNYVAVSQESAFSARCGTYCNGEIMVFNRKDDAIFRLLDAFDEMQLAERDEFRRNYRETPQVFYSTQSFFNNVFSGKYQHSVAFRPYVDYVGVGKLQSYLDRYTAIKVLPDEEWRPGRFLLHVFGIPNSDKIAHIEEFFCEYPEYR